MCHVDCQMFAGGQQLALAAKQTVQEMQPLVVISQHLGR